jgi:hypothetical protein
LLCKKNLQLVNRASFYWFQKVEGEGGGRNNMEQVSESKYSGSPALSLHRELGFPTAFSPVAGWPNLLHRQQQQQQQQQQRTGNPSTRRNKLADYEQQPMEEADDALIPSGKPRPITLGRGHREKFSSAGMDLSASISPSIEAPTLACAEVRTPISAMRSARRIREQTAADEDESAEAKCYAGDGSSSDGWRGFSSVKSPLAASPSPPLSDRSATSDSDGLRDPRAALCSSRAAACVYLEAAERYIATASLPKRDRPTPFSTIFTTAGWQ